MKRKNSFDDYSHPNNYYRKLHASSRKKFQRRHVERTSPTGLSQMSVSPTTPKGSTSNFWEKTAAQVAGAELGFIVGDVPGAVVGAVEAGKVYDFTHQMDVDAEQFDKSLLKKDIAMGKYLGKFNKGKKNKANYSDRGYTVKRETFGRMDDPQACYIGHSTWDHSLYAEAVTGALVRKLLLKAGIPVNDRYQELPLASIESATRFKVDFSVVNVHSGLVTEETTYTIVDNNTITSVVTGLAGMTAWIRLQLLNSDNPNAERPYNLCLYQGTVNNWELASKLDLNNERLDFYVSSTLTVQNRTAGDNAAVGERYAIDRIDNQPLTGKIYYFKNGDPQMRVPNQAQRFINLAVQDSALLLRASDLGADWQNVPNGNYWKNSVKSANVKLPVGAIKKTSLYKKWSMNFNTFITKMRCITYTAVAGYNYASQCPGICELIGLEEELRTSGTNHVTLQYQRSLVMGVVSVTQKVPPLKATFVTIERNNVTA